MYTKYLVAHLISEVAAVRHFLDAADLFLYVFVIYILKWLQFCGWGIDAQEIYRRFLSSPWDSQTSWITLLALTNLLPTLSHLLALCLSVFWGVFIQRSRQDEIVKVTNDLLNGRSLTKVEARQLYNCFYIDRIMGALTIGIVMLMFYPLLQLFVWYMLHWII